MSEVGYMAHRQKMLHTPDTFSFSPRERRFSKEAPNLKQTVSRNVNSSAWQAHEKTKCRVELLGKWRLLAKLLSCCVFSYLACLITNHHISRLLCFVPWMIFSSLVIDFDNIRVTLRIFMGDSRFSVVFLLMPICCKLQFYLHGVPDASTSVSDAVFNVVDEFLECYVRCSVFVF